SSSGDRNPSDGECKEAGGCHHGGGDVGGCAGSSAWAGGTMAPGETGALDSPEVYTDGDTRSISMAMTAWPVGPLRSRLPCRFPVSLVTIETSSLSATSSTRIQAWEGRSTQARAMGGPD